MQQNCFAVEASFSTVIPGGNVGGFAKMNRRYLVRTQNTTNFSLYLLTNVIDIGNRNIIIFFVKKEQWMVDITNREVIDVQKHFSFVQYELIIAGDSRLFFY